MKKLLFIIISTLLVSCASTLKLSNITPVENISKNYDLGKIYVVNVGEPIIEIRKDKIIPAFHVTSNYLPPGLGAGGVCKMPEIKKDMIFNAIYQCPEDGTYIIHNKEYEEMAKCSADPYEKSICLNIDENGDIIHGWISKNGDVAQFQGSNWQKNIFQKTKEGQLVEGSFKAEIVYSGFSGKIIKAIYREYVDNYARSAFSQELQWDITNNPIIGYKDIKIEVISLTPEFKVKVLKD